MAKIYPYQHNTPFEKGSVKKKITVIDPRHPFYGRKFPLVDIVKRTRTRTLCIVKLPNGIESKIPIAITDLSPDSLSIYPLSVDLKSIEKLVKTFEHIRSKSKKRG